MNKHHHHQQQQQQHRAESLENAERMRYNFSAENEIFSPFDVPTYCVPQHDGKRKCPQIVSDEESLKDEYDIMSRWSKRCCIRRMEPNSTNFDPNRNMRFARLLDNEFQNFQNPFEEENVDDSDPLSRWIESFLD